MLNLNKTSGYDIIHMVRVCYNMLQLSRIGQNESKLPELDRNAKLCLPRFCQNFVLDSN